MPATALYEPTAAERYGHAAALLEILRRHDEVTGGAVENALAMRRRLGTDVPCPRCGAAEGDACVAGALRIKSHPERVAASLAARKG